MADTIFIDGQTVIQAAWLNPINDHVYSDTPVTGTTVHDASKIAVTPAGAIAATNVQAALVELDNEKQPLDATLTALAGVSTGADKLIYSTGVDTFATTDLSAFARTLLDDVDASAARTTLNVQNVVLVSGSTAETVHGPIPSWATKIKVNFFSLTKSGAATELVVQVGTSSTVETTGYTSSLSDGTTEATKTDSFLLIAGGATTITGTFTLDRMGTSNTWIGTGTFRAVGSATSIITSGYITLGAALTHIQITTPGTGSMSAGSYTINYS